METHTPEIEQQMQWYYQYLREKDRRRYAAIEAGHAWLRWHHLHQ